jgi:hypothetical protein
MPQDCSKWTHNEIYSNNENYYDDEHDKYCNDVPFEKRRKTVVCPQFIAVVGAGFMWYGANQNLMQDNRIYDNWRRGTMLLAVPDAISCPPGTQTCTPANPSSTSYDNRFYDNKLGRAPSGKLKPNGVDFWWDEFPSDTGNCWYGNRGPDGTNASWTGDPQRFVKPGMSVPRFMPEDCGTSAGTGNPAKEAMLTYCAEASIGDTTCDWYAMPKKPGTAAAARDQRRRQRRARIMLASQRLSAPACQLVSDTLSCARYANRP